ncbi:NifX-associated nitrogen fixation protein [Azoarcus sp. KH32C]|uniref:NifX-associated nitrogen fixation protein n=1 Tax=Azoarcus sp. KH32C TaxID=748247 RepID=UPI00023865B2|nr:NifX-associated nitrogen fixation protein [Azoarcus sp. KH32C]BAL23119.1 hypothetical protein AZKH_0780 [Azoarcus sp. KH32C]
MSETLAPDASAIIAASPFLGELVKMMRAQDIYGSWDGKTDAEVLAPFVVDKAARKLIPIIDDPDPEVLWRLELFYNAIGIAIERRTSFIASPMIKINHEGFGRAILSAGRLIVYSKYHRDVHRFGFDTLQALGEAGDRIIEDAAAMVARFPDVANFG